jgi:hypothetical protein
MRRTADDDLLALVAETNDLRRVVGQALWHLRTLLLLARDRPGRFASAVLLWAAAAGTAFARMEDRLRRVGSDERDARLRSWLAAVLGDIARDAREGDRLLMPFARSLDTRLGEIGRLLREGAGAPRAFDVGLARDLAVALGAVARAAPRDVPERVADAAALVGEVDAAKA